MTEDVGGAARDLQPPVADHPGFMLVRVKDIEALFRQGDGSLRPPSGRGGQATSQTNRYFALKRLFDALPSAGSEGDA